MRRDKEVASEWAKQALNDPKTVVLDLETTGILSKDPDTEISQITILDLKRRPLLSMLLKPNKPMSDEIVGIHGITNDQVRDQPIFPQVAKIISFVLEGKNVLAYNADFDIKLLWHMFRKYEVEVPKTVATACVMDEFSQWVGDWSDKKQGYKWQKLPNLSGLPPHDSYSDCVSTILLLERMAGGKSIEEVDAEEISLAF